MAALALVSDYLTEARALMQDTVVPYRYADADLIRALNIGLLECRRIRPDLFIGRMDAVPDYTTTGQTVVFDQQYRSALVYYIVGRAGIRDDEPDADQRASAFLNKFLAQLQTVQA